MAQEIIIQSEEDAWHWLRLALAKDPEVKEAQRIRFDGWPALDLRFRGRDFDSSVPTRIMPPLLDAQKEIHRLYCQLRYGEQNLRRLRNDERERLELVVRVKKGSSEYQTNLFDTLTEIGKVAVGHMDSLHILIALITGALTWGSVVGWKHWLNSQEKIKEIESRVKMSSLENEKLKTLNEAHQRLPALKNLAEGVDEFRNDSLHKLKEMDEFELPGTDVEIDGEYASKITHTPREKSVEIRLDGEFLIQAVVSGQTRGFKLKVMRVIDGMTVAVRIPEGTLTQDELDILKNNEWAKKPVQMAINAKLLRDQITSATLVSASEITAD